jgi:hypothetical protein
MFFFLSLSLRVISVFNLRGVESTKTPQKDAHLWDRLVEEQKI